MSPDPTAQPKRTLCPTETTIVDRLCTLVEDMDESDDVRDMADMLGQVLIAGVDTRAVLAAAVKRMRATADEIDSESSYCQTCGGHGGGPDPALYCTGCGGSGNARSKCQREAP